MIISGGQTGVDRAALDVALELHLPCGGWCPKGRRAEDGCIPERYPLKETSTAAYPQRTESNVRDSDGTLVLTVGEPNGGTALTIALARRHSKHHLVVNLNQKADMKAIRQWRQSNRIEVLNVAGPRESENPGIYSKAYTFLHQLLANNDNEKERTSHA